MDAGEEHGSTRVLPSAVVVAFMARLKEGHSVEDVHTPTSVNCLGECFHILVSVRDKHFVKPYNVYRSHKTPVLRLHSLQQMKFLGEGVRGHFTAWDYDRHGIFANDRIGH